MFRALKLFLLILLVGGAARAQTVHDRIALDSNAAIVQTYVAGGAVAAGQLVTLNGLTTTVNGTTYQQVVIVTTAASAGVLGVSETTAASGATVLVAYLGQVPAIATDGACTAGNFLSISATVNGAAHCTSAAASVESIGFSFTTLGSTGSVTGNVSLGGSGGSGGGASPAGNPGDAQCRNGSAFAACHINDGGTYAGQITISENSAFTGPRPYIDVNAYGAVGNNAVNDQPAIQAAINAYCNSQTLSNGGTIYFPPGTYLVAQPQLPSTAPVFTICQGIHLLGGNSALHEGEAAFNLSPSVSIIAAAGASPNTHAVFECIFPQCGGGVTIENIGIQGVNQAVYFNQSSGNRLQNDSLSVFATGQTDNTPLKLCNSVWNQIKGGSIFTNSTTAIPGVLMCTDGTAGNFTQMGLTDFENVLMSGGTFSYRAGIDNTGSPGGNITFTHITIEGANNCVLCVTETTPGFLGGMSDISFDNVNLSDSTPAYLIDWNVNSLLSGVFVKSSGLGSGLIVRRQGQIASVFATADGASASSVQVVDASGNPVGGAVTQNQNGFDYIADTTNPQRLQSDLKNLFAGLGSGGLTGPSGRYTASGAAFARLAIDPLGVYFGEGSNYGFSTEILSGGLNDTDLAFSKLLPPTNVSGAATTGGSLAGGTYYYYIRSSSVNNSTGCLDSTDSAVSSAVVVGGSNTAVNLTWSLPGTNSTSTPAGFCVYRSQVANGTVEDGNALILSFVSGGTTTTATDTGGGTGGNVGAAIPTYVTAHRFTATGLEINTLACTTFNLCVNGSAQVLGPENYYTDTGAANAYVVTTSPALTAIPDGYWITFKAAHANSGTSTLAVDGLTAYTIKKNANGANLASSDIGVGQQVCVQYDAANTVWQMQCTLGNAAGAGSLTIETLGSNNSSQTILNFITSTTNSCNTTLTPSNPGGVGNEKFEATGTENVFCGGTGVSNPTVHAVAIGENTSPFNFVTTATAGLPLLSQSGADPAFGALNLSLSGSTTGNLPCTDFPVLTGDVTTSLGSCATNVAALQGNTLTISGLTVGQVICSTGTAAFANCSQGAAPNVQSGTSYAVVGSSSGSQGDRLKYIYATNSSAMAMTIAQAGTTGFTNNFTFGVIANGTAAVTLTPTTSTINGAASIVIEPGMNAIIVSDNSNYFAFVSARPTGGVNTQTASYAATLLDDTKLVVMNCSSACTFTLPATPPTTTPTNRWWVGMISIGSSLPTISLNGLTFNGGSSAPVAIKYEPIWFDSDGSNYFGNAPLVAGSQITLTPAANGLTVAASSSVGAALSAITAAVGSNTIANGNNPQVWNWAQTTNAQSAFTFGETTAASGTGDIEVNVQTKATSTALPIQITALGTTVGWNMSTAGLWEPLSTGALATGLTAHTVPVNEGATTALAAVATGVANDILASAGSSADPTMKSLADLSPTLYVAGAGSVNVMTATLAPPATSLTAGLTVYVLPNLANTTTTPTLNVSGLGAKTITKNGTAALIAGDYTTTAIAEFQYDGTEWQLQNPQGGGGVSGLTTGFFTKAASATSLSNTLCDEGITTSNVVTCTDTGGFKIVALATGTSPPTCAAGTGGAECFGEGTAATAVASVDDLHADSTQKALEVNNNNTGEMPVSRVTCVNVTPVTVNANVTSDQNLMTCTLAANALNVVGRTIHVHAAGIYSTAAASTAQLTAKAKLCTVSGCGSGTVISLVSIQTVALGSVSVTNNNWNLDFYSTTQTAGGTAAFEAHGQFVVDPGALTTAVDAIYADTNTGTVSSIDTTAQLFLQITFAYSAGSTSNSVSQRQGVVEVLN